MPLAEHQFQREPEDFNQNLSEPYPVLPTEHIQFSAIREPRAMTAITRHRDGYHVAGPAPKFAQIMLKADCANLPADVSKRAQNLVQLYLRKRIAQARSRHIYCSIQEP